REAFHHFGGGSDGIPGGESRPGGQCALAAGVVAIDEVRAGENSARISFHGSPPQTTPESFHRHLSSWALSARRSQNPGSTSRIGRSRCTFRARLHGVDDSPWN